MSNDQSAQVRLLQARVQDLQQRLVASRLREQQLREMLLVSAQCLVTAQTAQFIRTACTSTADAEVVPLPRAESEKRTLSAITAWPHITKASA